MRDKDFKERLIELVKDDKELHDATVRLINALAEQTEINNSYRKKRLNNMGYNMVKEFEKVCPACGKLTLCELKSGGWKCTECGYREEKYDSS